MNQTIFLKFFYNFDLFRILICFLSSSGISLVVFSGVLAAAWNSLWYTQPSQHPRVDRRTSSRKSKLSTRGMARGLMVERRWLRLWTSLSRWENSRWANLRNFDGSSSIQVTAINWKRCERIFFSVSETGLLATPWLNSDITKHLLWAFAASTRIIEQLFQSFSLFRADTALLTSP